MLPFYYCKDTLMVRLGKQALLKLQLFSDLNEGSTRTTSVSAAQPSAEPPGRCLCRNLSFCLTGQVLRQAELPLEGFAIQPKSHQRVVGRVR